MVAAQKGKTDTWNMTHLTFWENSVKDWKVKKCFGSNGGCGLTFSFKNVLTI